MRKISIDDSKFNYSITHWFQPIYCLKNLSIIGYEALLRDASKLHISPNQIFKEAEEKGCQSTLDLMSIKTALNNFRNESNLIFINIFPSTLLKGNFLYWWDTNIPEDMPVVLELLENEPVENWKELKKVTRGLRARGVKIAVDDMGAGYSFFQQWIELEPDYIKLDRYFASNLAVNPRKQRIVRFLVDLLVDSTKLIIEGVETEADLNAAELLGISYGQGYYLGKPSPKENLIL
ncbi:EAL domain-containing protein [Pseudoclostridium thermosuccinogenes]|uniref:EAL domain-containing protein n=1 Tax=Clostridium thermosuccinogenes TaxID=84032 RepID=UPI001FA8AF01|nr:EAL domain-containing protein [Pseudoclostridium thermosuccinogenes]